VSYAETVAPAPGRIQQRGDVDVSFDLRCVDRFVSTIMYIHIYIHTFNVQDAGIHCTPYGMSFSLTFGKCLEHRANKEGALSPVGDHLG